MNAEPIDDDDAVWRALANPVRRRLLDLLRDGPQTTSDLVAAIGGGRHPVLQHLAVLRDAELVVVEPRGRQRINYLNPVPIQLIYERWVSAYTESWTAALVGLKHAVERTSPQRTGPERTSHERTGPERTGPNDEEAGVA